MPWVNEEMCTGCGTCLDTCPTDAIALMENGLANINDDECIRCGQCHDVCPENAVRHDKERIPLEVQANLEMVRNLLKHYDTAEDKRGFIGRMVRHFEKERKVAENTVAAVEKMQAEAG